jgi:hypothetical protein
MTTTPSLRHKSKRSLSVQSSLLIRSCGKVTIVCYCVFLFFKKIVFFKLSDLSAVAAALLLGVTTNMLLYEKLPVCLCIVVHVLTMSFGVKILQDCHCGQTDIWRW